MQDKRPSRTDNWVMIGQDLLKGGTNIKFKSSLRVKDFMRSNFIILNTDDPLQMAAEAIINGRTDGVPIVDGKGNMVGLLTKTTVLREVLAGTDLQTPVGQVMITNVFYTDPDEDVSQLITINVGNLPVVKDGKVLGIVTLSDTIRAYFSSLIVLREELYTIIDSTHNGILTVNEEDRVILLNKAAEDFLGLKQEDVFGTPITDILPESRLPEIMRSGSGEFGQKLTYKDRVFVSNQTPIVSNGEIIGAVAVFQDISELERISEELPYTKLIREELEQAQNLSEHYKEQLEKYGLMDKYVIRSQKSRDLADLCIRLGKVDATVLIQGESGAGKEIAAQIIHSSSSRCDRPMISINCASIPESLLESELFGYAPGAFTGAIRSGKPGIFETANGGTLFLDEVADLPLGLQAKLLRVIQEREITRVGSNTPISVDVRLITATNRDLREMVKRREFRQDLFFRLNVVPVTVPPLRERKAEIPFFVAHFLNKFNDKYSLNKRIDERTIKEMVNYDWPGNVRELENFIERVVVTYPGDVIRNISVQDIDSRINDMVDLDIFSGDALRTAVEKLEKYMIKNSLETLGSTRKAAHELGVSQPTIVRKAARYGIKIRE